MSEREFDEHELYWMHFIFHISYSWYFDCKSVCVCVFVAWMNETWKRTEDVSPQTQYNAPVE